MNTLYYALLFTLFVILGWEIFLTWTAPSRYLDLFIIISQTSANAGALGRYDTSDLYRKAKTIYHRYGLSDERFNLPAPDKLVGYVEFEEHNHITIPELVWLISLSILVLLILCVADIFRSKQERMDDEYAL